MLLPARTAVLNYLYEVKNADISQIMEALKPLYGGERQFSKKLYTDHVMSLEANGLVNISSYDLDKDGELRVYYEINDDGRSAVDKYVDKKYRSHK
jgi:DNA-binding PadR family transcriptional regulator